MTRQDEIITMLDDDGHPHDFTLVEVLEVDARRYAVLQPEDGDSAVLFRVEGEAMALVEDDTEFRRVVEALRSLDEYDDLVVEDEEDEPLQDTDEGVDLEDDLEANDDLEDDDLEDDDDEDVDEDDVDDEDEDEEEDLEVELEEDETDDPADDELDDADEEDDDE